MTKPHDLDELAARCEAADPAAGNALAYLDLDIQRAVVDARAELLDAPPYTASLDAAMTLVPEGWHIMHLCEGPDVEPRPRDFAYDGTFSVVLHTPQKGLLHNLEYGAGATPAIALTAAALRARASLTRSLGGG